jgi:hypothetical protein
VHLYQWKQFYVTTLCVVCWVEEHVVLLYLTRFVKWDDFSSLGYVNNIDGFSDKVMSCYEFFPFLLKVSW